jgi:hypothetical protein
MLFFATRPVCIYPEHHEEPVAIGDIPSSVMSTFRNACPHAELTGTWKYYEGGEFIYFVVRFQQDGRLQEALITPPRKLERIYDVQTN